MSRLRALFAAILLRLNRLTRIERAVFVIEGNTEKIMKQNEAILAIVGQLNDETNTIASRIDSLNAQIATATAAGQPIAQETMDALQAVSDRLKALGADPTNPIPAPAA